MAKAPQYIQVYAILRHDGYLDEFGGPEKTIKVKEVVYDLETAEREVERLNRLRAESDVVYWWQTTHLYPPGTAAAEEDEPTDGVEGG